jgi:hypothetical protein
MTTVFLYSLGVVAVLSAALGGWLGYRLGRRR